MAARPSTPPDPAGNVFAVLGTDDAEVKRAARALALELTPAAGGDFGLDTIDGQAENSDAAAGRIHQTVEALLTLPFFGGEKLVWLKSANFLSDTVIGKSAAVLEGLESLAATLSAGLPPGVRFLLSATDPDKRRTFTRNLGKIAKVEIFDKLDTSRSGWEEEAAITIRRLAREHGVEIRDDALELFALFTGGERRVIESELEKLSLYLTGQGRPATAEDVRLLVPMSRAGVIWELGNALAERNLRRCLDSLELLLFQGEKVIGILIVAIIPTIRNLLIVKDLMTRHKLQRPQQPFFFGKTLEKLPPEATAHLPRKKEGGINGYSLGIAATHVQRYTLPELQRGLEACLHTNEQLVTSSLDPEVALSQLLIRLTSKAR